MKDINDKLSEMLHEVTDKLNDIENNINNHDDKSDSDVPASDKADVDETDNAEKVDDEDDCEFNNEKIKITKKSLQEFYKIIKDFINDINCTFPEQYENFTKDLEDINKSKEFSECIDAVKHLFAYSLSIYPERFFDILYQNNEIFENNEINTVFLPNIEFKDLVKTDVSDKTREIIWKYLQLILLSIMGSIKNKESFGDTSNLFEAINGDEFKNKLNETLNNIQGMFDNSGNDMKDLPNPDEIHDHVNDMLNGKIGNLAREIAEETADTFDIKEGNDVNSVFQQLFKNPTKLMGLVKTVGSKLDTKIKSGEIKESELIEEATQLMQQMNDFPGMDNMQDVFSKMGLNFNKKNSMNAFNKHMDENKKKALNKERLQEKLRKRKESNQTTDEKKDNTDVKKEDTTDDNLTFMSYNGSDDKPEKTPINANKKKRKKKKNRK